MSDQKLIDAGKKQRLTRLFMINKVTDEQIFDYIDSLMTMDSSRLTEHYKERMTCNSTVKMVGSTMPKTHS